MRKKSANNLINFLNYKDIIIILGLWFFVILIISTTRTITFNHETLTNIFHFLFTLSGRFLFLGITGFYLTSLYPISFKDLGFKLASLRSDFKLGFQIILIFMFLILVIINIPLSFNPEGNFSPLVNIRTPEDFVNSLLPLFLLFTGLLIIALSEQLLISGIVFELFSNTIFNKYLSVLLAALFYSVILLDFEPTRILINTITVFISLLLYLKNHSLIPPSVFMAGYYALYMVYISGWNYIKF